MREMSSLWHGNGVRLPDPYTLPAMDFVGGSTQDLVFHCYHYMNKKAHDLSSCTAKFAIINFVNKNGKRLVSKDMDIGADPSLDGEIKNVLRTTLAPSDTVNLPAGKYIYQITIKDITGDVYIPNHGIIHIINNIDKESV